MQYVNDYFNLHILYVTTLQIVIILKFQTHIHNSTADKCNIHVLSISHRKDDRITCLQAQAAYIPENKKGYAKKRGMQRMQQAKYTATKQ